MAPPPVTAASLRQYWRELAASGVALTAIAAAMAAATALQGLGGLALGTTFAFAGAAYALTAAIPFTPRLRAALVVLALAYVVDGVLLAREQFVFGIAMVLALALALTVGGLYGIVYAIRRRRLQRRWAIGTAVSALAAAAILAASLPASAAWTVGPAFALATLAHAMALLRLARAGRVLERRVLAQASPADASADAASGEGSPIGRDVIEHSITREGDPHFDDGADARASTNPELAVQRAHALTHAGDSV